LKKLYVFRSKAGPFYVSKSDDGRFHVVFREQSLGSYPAPLAAANDIGGRDTLTLPGGMNPVALGVPRDISKWERVKPA
jgi:hypothetical protein